ncbi:hypothetical protein FCM35_KLT13675 [Carex littledalei]|uniref:EXS domain-containing protein n=1 Tax=Carex littledalei TaxID=544730 RepID=A0A833QP71_9POAL|nr:hypothetical protein FCM35_KLT13675 [Carex littledalei]
MRLSSLGLIRLLNLNLLLSLPCRTETLKPLPVHTASTLTLFAIHSFSPLFPLSKPNPNPNFVVAQARPHLNLFAPSHGASLPLDPESVRPKVQNGGILNGESSGLKSKLITNHDVLRGLVDWLCSQVRYFTCRNTCTMLLFLCKLNLLDYTGDMGHLINLGKYVSAMLAAGAKVAYEKEKSPGWLVLVVAMSSGATMYQLYWDFGSIG